jgi:hypothetical protein
VAYQGSGYAPPVVYQVRSGAGVYLFDSSTANTYGCCLKSPLVVKCTADAASSVRTNQPKLS